jgi:hypothetical protein
MDEQQPRLKQGGDRKKTTLAWWVSGPDHIALWCGKSAMDTASDYIQGRRRASSPLCPVRCLE